MEASEFEYIINGSPVLSAAVKEALIKNAEALDDATKKAIVEKLLAFEGNVLKGGEEFLADPFSSIGQDDKEGG